MGEIVGHYGLDDGDSRVGGKRMKLAGAMGRIFTLNTPARIP